MSKIKPTIKRITTFSGRGRVGSARIGKASFHLKKKRADYRLRTGKIQKIRPEDLLK